MLIVREISVPAPFTVGEHDNVAAMVFEHERDDPDYVIYQRLIDGVWTDVTCAEAANQIRAAALGLISLGVQAGDRVVIFSATRYEWAILDFAILAVGAVTVPIYETSSAEQVRWVLQDSEAVVLFAETDSHATMVAELSGSVPALREVLQIAGSGPNALDRLTEAGASVDPAELTARLAALRSTDPATLIYTSGTTGRPKGCQLTQSNLVHEIKGARAYHPTLLRKGERLLVFHRGLRGDREDSPFAGVGGVLLGGVVHLGHFYRGAGLTIYEGYGLSGTSGGVAISQFNDLKIGTVGKPVPGNSLRIADDGELLVRGGVVFSGYWRNEQATTEAFTDGWFKTGDLGAVDEDGFLTITGRKKEIIVTAGGKNVAPAVLEDQLRAHPLISQAVVVGDAKPFIGALITIDPEAFEGWKQRNSKTAGASVGDLATDPDLIAEIDAAVKQANLAVSHAESIRKFRILPVDFTEDTGELTPTMKVKRKVVAEKFASDIEAIYNKE